MSFYSCMKYTDTDEHHFPSHPTVEGTKVLALALFGGRIRRVKVIMTQNFIAFKIFLRWSFPNTISTWCNHQGADLSRTLICKFTILVQNAGTDSLENKATKDIWHTSINTVASEGWYFQVENYHNFPFLTGDMRNRYIKRFVQNDIGISGREESQVLLPTFQTTYLLDICPKKLNPLFYVLLWCSNWWNLKQNITTNLKNSNPNDFQRD